MKTVYLRLTLLFFFFSLFIFKIYYDRIGTFSFGDEYNNIVAGYFMLRGRALFSQIFFNHQMIMAYLSFAIQKFFHPETLYKLVLYHRMFMIIFSIGMDYVLVLRFRFKALSFVILYEVTKYYLFGNLFLAESLIVYALVYLLFLCWDVINNRKIFPGDIIVSGIFTWFVIFLREPFIPLALFLYGYIIWKQIYSKITFISLGVFFILSVVSILPVSLKDYWYQVFAFNFFVTVPSQKNVLFQVLIYPLAIFIGGKWNIFRYMLILLDLDFLFLTIILLYKKQFKKIFFFFFILFLAGFRPVDPGIIFYEAFHMVVWYGLFIGTIFAILEEVHKYRMPWAWYISFTGALLLVICILSPRSFIWEKVNKQQAFTINYAIHYIDGEAIRILANPKDTMFADSWDYLLYWQAGIDSSYKYAVYTFIMKHTELFQKARADMFFHTPPDFYYTYSPDSLCKDIMPASSINSYLRLYSKDTHVCMYIKQKKIPQIKKTQWDRVRELGFYIK